VSMADGALSARDPTAPIGMTDPGLVSVRAGFTRSPGMRGRGWIMSIKLTDVRRVMLSTAAQRADLRLAPPDKLRGAILAKVSDKLAKAGLVREVRAKVGAPIWRRDHDGQSYALKLTAAGLKAIAVDNESNQAIVAREAPQSQSNSVGASATADANDAGEAATTVTPRAGSKLALVIEHLQRAEGVTLVDLTQATGWLPHTTRAALSGLRKRGYAVIRERIGAGGSVYRISDSHAYLGDGTVLKHVAVDNRGPKRKAIEAA
jgi:Protein of unknown function (DUF3489)